MLVAHSDKRDNGDARVLVHDAGWRLDDECWIIKGVKENGVTVGYTFMKSQVFKQNVFSDLKLVSFRLKYEKRVCGYVM